MFLANFRLKLRIMQQQVCKFCALLYQVKLCHPLRFAFKLRRRNADQFAEHIARIVESQRLVEITSKDITFNGFLTHLDIRFYGRAKDQLKTLMNAIRIEI